MSDAEDTIIADLAVAMKYKFMVHRNKGGWHAKHLDTLMSELQREVDELAQAHTKEQIISECADIANYCAMIIETIKKDKK
ncbi:MAG: hypothetical protein JHC33_08820 [Ignisphaera sp.]|nr:hypothetical protein [Ignisphaera sp.]